tara:strand:+ start:326 stop:490 length:165 start_codon:yes stop_codon:yes gene_type:complete
MITVKLGRSLTDDISAIWMIIASAERSAQHPTGKLKSYIEVIPDDASITVRRQI